MRKSRFDRIWQGLNAAAQTVYESVPMAEAWSVNQITQELSRVGKCRDVRVVQGCLHSLCSSGVVQETGKGLFIRVAIKEPTQQAQLDDEQQTEKDTEVKPDTKISARAPAKATTPIDVLAPIAASARSVAKQLLTLADQVDEAALAIEGRVSEVSEEVAKLRQLQQLLKSLG